MSTFLSKSILPALAVFAFACALRADVTSYAIFKVENYHQIDASPPTGLDTPNAYYLGAQLFSSDEGEIVNDATMGGPTGSFPMPGGDGAFYYNTSYYADDASLTADYPGGTYDFQINSDTDDGTLQEPGEELFTSVIPAFSPDTWCRMQSANAACPIKLCWNQFVPNPDAAVAWIFVRILDPEFNYAYTTNFLDPTTTNICIPAYNLEAGTTYQIQLLFSDRAGYVGEGFSDAALATAGFDALTYTSLVTVPPCLSIARGTNADTVVLSWTIAASNFALESTCSLSDTNWCPVTNTPCIVNNQNVVCLPVCGKARFFQLYQP